jgi:hypothetical protein
MTENFADVLVGSIKSMTERISTIEKGEKMDKQRLQSLEKDVESIKNNMSLVIQYINSSSKG